MVVVMMPIIILISGLVNDLNFGDMEFNRMVGYATMTLGSEGFQGNLDLIEVSENLYVAEGILGPDAEEYTVSIEYLRYNDERAKITIFADVGNAAQYVDMRSCWDYKKIVSFPISN